MGPRIVRDALWCAAALVLIVAVTVIGWHAGVDHVDERVARSSLTYTTANGERATITLPDGNTVALNVASRLEVPADYAAGDHTVRLVGEGMFTVLHHSGEPFTVLAGANAARVLGTSFVVRHYPSDTTTLVAVRDGKISVRGAVLHAAQQAELSGTGQARVQAGSPSLFTFAMGTLTLDSVPLSAAAPELSRWYDADIQLGDPVLATRRVTGECAAGSLADLTEYLSETLNLRVVRHGRVLTLYPR